MNEELRSMIKALDKIKEETGASYVRISAYPFEDITVQIDWEDNSHTQRRFTYGEIERANFDILPIVIEYANKAHKMLLEGKI